jgi:hypothetical protein
VRCGGTLTRHKRAIRSKIKYKKWEIKMSRLELENLMTKVRLYVQMVSGEFWIFGATTGQTRQTTRSLSSLFILLLSHFLFSLLNPLAIHLVHA